MEVGRLTTGEVEGGTGVMAVSGSGQDRPEEHMGVHGAHSEHSCVHISLHDLEAPDLRGGEPAGRGPGFNPRTELIPGE
ncbi:unnamed protein product [Boreogadus saida]